MKAIVIISGGLDSSLAIKAIQKQGIEVLAVHFLIPFVNYDIFSLDSSPAARIAKQLKCQFEVVILGKKYLKMLESPKYGYGKNLNPCIDCKILMLKEAKKIMKKHKASFIVTGEVLGQRPMSQHKPALLKITRASRLEGLLVRPLSAKLLPPTIPEKKGWLKQDFLFDSQGRSRKPQIALAKQWGVRDYPWPAGGCLLTDANFCRRLKDLIEYRQCSLENIELLKAGRHFRISPGFKLIVGRDEKDNQKISKLMKKGDLFFEPKDLPGPLGLGRGIIDQKTKQLAAQIIASYTSLGPDIKIMAKVYPRGRQELILVKGRSHDNYHQVKI